MWRRRYKFQKGDDSDVTKISVRTSLPLSSSNSCSPYDSARQWSTYALGTLMRDVSLGDVVSRSVFRIRFFRFADPDCLHFWLTPRFAAFCFYTLTSHLLLSTLGNLMASTKVFSLNEVAKVSSCTARSSRGSILNVAHTISCI